MMARWVRILKAAAMLGGIAGCTTSGPSLKTPMPERFALPPNDDPRFSQPIAYPKETLNEDQVIKPSNNNSKLPSQTAPIAPTGRYGGAGGPGL